MRSAITSKSVILLLILILSTSSLFPQYGGNNFEKTNGPYGGEIFTVLPHPNGYVFAGTYSNGLYRSSDKGEHWSKLEIDCYSIGTLGLSKSGNILASCYYSTPNLFVSEDNGETWTPISNVDHFYSIKLDEITGKIWGGGHGKIFVSSDEGFSWQSIKITNSDIYSIEIDNNGNIYAGTWGDGLYKSSDNGNSWKKLSLGLGSDHVPSLQVDSSNDIYAGVYYTGSWWQRGRLYRSKDEGATWELKKETPDRYTFRSFIITRENTILLATHEGRIFRGENLGHIWQPITIGYSNMKEIKEDADGNIFLCSRGGSLLKSTDDGITWQDKANGIDNYNALSIIITSDNQVFTASQGSGRIYRSDNFGKQWIPTNLIIKEPAVNFEYNNGTLFLSTWDEVYLTTDSGDSWSRILHGYRKHKIGKDNEGNVYFCEDTGILKTTDNGHTFKKIFNDNITDIAFDSQNNYYAGKRNNSILKSTDEGNTWATYNITDSTWPGVVDIEIDSKDNIYAALAYSGFYQSSDGGTTWQKVNTIGNRNVKDVVITENDEIYAVVGQSIYVSYDYGYLWRFLYSLRGYNYFNCIDINSRGNIFAGSSISGVYRSKLPTYPVLLSYFWGITNNKEITLIWETEEDTLNIGFEVFRKDSLNQQWEKIGFVEAGNSTANKYSFTDRLGDYGVYYYYLNQISTDSLEEKSNEIKISTLENRPTTFELYQNYPNPFNATTVIKYTLPFSKYEKSSLVQLKIFDILGKEISTLVNQKQPTGFYEVEFNAENLSSGIYIYRIEYGNMSQTKKMLLLK